MHFGRDIIKYVYEMNGVCLEAVSIERDLGIEISADLKVCKSVYEGM